MDNELRIKEVAAKHGMTLKDIAEKLGLNYVAFCNTLRNNPTIATIKKVANVIGVPTGTLIKGGFIAVVIEGDETKTYYSREELKEAL